MAYLFRGVRNPKRTGIEPGRPGLHWVAECVFAVLSFGNGFPDPVAAVIEAFAGRAFRINGADRMIKRILSVSPWASLALVAAATLSPLTLRPHVSAAHIEHVAAYAFIGLLFGLVYPRQMFMNCVIVLGTATLLETLQLLTPDRHGRIEDLAFKLAGALAGIVAGKIAARQIALWRR